MSGFWPNSWNNFKVSWGSNQLATITYIYNTHSGEKVNKCNQCNFASSQAGNLRTHLMKTHGGEKSNKSDIWKILNPLINLKR